MELAAAGGARDARDDPPLAAVASYGPLPVDMLHDILLRLPADEVCRLRLVCRAWRSLLASDRHFARAHASRHPQPHVIVVGNGNHGGEASAEVRDVDLRGNVIRRIRIRRPVVGPLSVHGDLLCASHGWGLTSVADMATGAVVDVAADPLKKVNSPTPYCVLGHVPATGEYKVLRIQADYCCRRRRQRCDVVTLGGGGGNGRWRRRRTGPPVALRIKPWSSSWSNVAVVAGLAYFLVDEVNVVEADLLAVFDLATEEWQPAMLQGPLTRRLLAVTPSERRVLHSPNFQLATLSDSLVVVYHNSMTPSTELWFLEDMADDGTATDTATAHWSRRYTLPWTLFRDDKFSFLRYHYHYPLAILDDGRILAWVERMSALTAYHPDTSTWTDLTTLGTGDCVIGMHHGSLLCSSFGAAQP